MISVIVDVERDFCYSRCRCRCRCRLLDSTFFQLLGVFDMIDAFMISVMLMFCATLCSVIWIAMSCGIIRGF